MDTVLLTPREGEKRFSPEEANLRFFGRIDDTDKSKPVFVWVCSGFRMRFTGRICRFVVENHRNCWENRIGIVVNGQQTAFLLKDDRLTEIDLAPYLTEEENDVLFFKRQDSAHYVTLHGIYLDENAIVLPLPPREKRRIEVFGDSVCAGEVCECVSHTGMTDPPHRGQYSNSWYSFAWETARRLGAELHDIAQGGIPLQDGRGWFNMPDYLGMLSCWDKLRYNPYLGKVTPWDFSLWTPHVAVVALGQNDAHPDNFMHEDPKGEKARQWKRDYEGFVRGLRRVYPRAQIILCTTVLCHDPEWDDAIGEVCDGLADERIHHFLFTRNGRGTPGHPRIPEHMEMADELAAFIDSLPDVWTDDVQGDAL